jgi:hypothetical protein
MTKRFAVVLLALLLAAACRGKSSPSSSPKASAVATVKPQPAVSRPPVTGGAVNRPVAGLYKYLLSGMQGTNVPGGAEIDEQISVSGDIFTSRITNNENPNYSILERHWTASGVLLDRTETHLQGKAASICAFQPPIKVVPLPLTTETLPNQQWGNSSCSGVTMIKVDGEVTTSDGNGKVWKVWKIEEKTQTPTIDVQVHYFSPDLGVDVRDERNAQTGGTVTLLTAHP